MKNQLKFRFVFLVLVNVCVFTTGFQSLNAQNKVRLKANYVKIMDGDIYVDIEATSKIEKRNVKVSNIDLTIFNEFENEAIKTLEMAKSFPVQIPTHFRCL